MLKQILDFTLKKPEKIHSFFLIDLATLSTVYVTRIQMGRLM